MKSLFFTLFILLILSLLSVTLIQNTLMLHELLTQQFQQQHRQQLLLNCLNSNKYALKNHPENLIIAPPQNTQFWVWNDWEKNAAPCVDYPDARVQIEKLPDENKLGVYKITVALQLNLKRIFVLKSYVTSPINI